MFDWFVMPGIMSRSRGFEKSWFCSALGLLSWDSYLAYQVSRFLSILPWGRSRIMGNKNCPPFSFFDLGKKSSNDVTSTGQIKSASPKGWSFMASSKSFLPWNSLRLSKTQTPSAQSNRQLIWQCQESIGIMRCMSSIKLGTSWGQWKHLHYVENLLIMPFSF